jgi:AraC-like DNA-binding protein
MDTLTQIHRFSDASEISELVRRFGYSVAYVRVSPGPLDVEAFEIRVDGCVVYRERFGCQVVAQGSSAPEGFGIMVAKSGTVRFFGVEVSPKKVVLFPPGCHIDAVGLPGVETIHYLLPSQRITAAAARWGVELVRSPRALVVEPGIDRLHHLQTVLKTIGGILEADDLARWPEAKEDLVDTFLGLFDVAALGEARISRPIRAVTEHAVRAQNYICSSAPDELDLESLASALGITRHHLNRCFKEHYSVSLHDFVHLCRLHQARELLMNRGSKTSVTEAAYSCGFSHLGRFSTEYKRLFGETARQTLRGGVEAT